MKSYVRLSLGYFLCLLVECKPLARILVYDGQSGPCWPYHLKWQFVHQAHDHPSGVFCCYFERCLSRSLSQNICRFRFLFLSLVVEDVLPPVPASFVCSFSLMTFAFLFSFLLLGKAVLTGGTAGLRKWKQVCCSGSSTELMDESIGVREICSFIGIFLCISGSMAYAFVWWIVETGECCVLLHWSPSVCTTVDGAGGSPLFTHEGRDCGARKCSPWFSASCLAGDPRSLQLTIEQPGGAPIDCSV